MSSADQGASDEEGGSFSWSVHLFGDARAVAPLETQISGPDWVKTKRPGLMHLHDSLLRRNQLSRR